MNVVGHGDHLEFCANCKEALADHDETRCLFMPGCTFKYLDGCDKCIESPGYVDRYAYDMYGSSYSPCDCELGRLITAARERV